MDTLKIKTIKLIELCRDAAERGSVVITGHDNPDADSVISAVMMKRLMERCGVVCSVKFPTSPDNVTLRDARSFGIWDDDFVCPFDDGDVLLLVDHHKSFYQNTAIACVDHHTTLPVSDCRFPVVIKASSCGKIIYDMMAAVGVADEEDEKLALYSVYLDTQSCRSSKFNKADLPWVDECIGKYGIDRESIERMGFCLNSPNEPIDVIATYAFKKYEFEKVSASTAIQIDDSDPSWESIIPAAIEIMKCKAISDGYAMWAFVVNMPMRMRSDIYFILDSGEVRKLELDRLASRSRDVIPVVSSIK